MFYLLYELARCTLQHPLNQINVSVSGTMTSAWDVWVGVSYMRTQQRNLNLFNPQKPPSIFSILEGNADETEAAHSKIKNKTLPEHTQNIPVF